jgi:hypothetical protein
MADTIFGYSWEDIQKMQQGKYIRPSVPVVPMAHLTDDQLREAFLAAEDAGTLTDELRNAIVARCIIL